MRRIVAPAAVTAFAAMHVVVVTVPAVVIAAAARKGGLADLHGLDLVVTSLLVGTAHAGLVWRRLVAELRAVEVRADAFIAAFDALVVLAAVFTALVLGVLGGWTPQNVAIVNHGWPVLALWLGGLLLASVVAEGVRSLVLRWLEPDTDLDEHLLPEHLVPEHLFAGHEDPPEEDERVDAQIPGVDRRGA